MVFSISSYSEYFLNPCKEAKVVDITYDCLEQMDNLILQSSKGVHLLFDKEDIVEAFSGNSSEDEKNLDKLRKIQEVLYNFISLKGYSEKRNFLKTLSRSEYSLLIRAYFKIVENSMMGRLKIKH